MHRFRLLGFYVVGIVAMVGLTIGGVSMRRSADDHGARESSEKETVAPTAVNAESISVTVNQFGFQPKELIVPARTNLTSVDRRLKKRDGKIRQEMQPAARLAGHLPPRPPRSYWPSVCGTP
jgi:hypothetical protein